MKYASSVCRGISLAVFAGMALSTQPARAQGVIQQPVIGRFGLQTVVSVPDRGSALLGGVGSAGRIIRRDGLLPIGSSVGGWQRRGGMSASVYVHDFAALEEELIGPGRAGQRSHRVLGDPAVMSQAAAQASGQLLRRHQALRGSEGSGPLRHADQAAPEQNVGRFGSRSFR